MAVITVPGPLSGKGYRIQIAGDSPTMDEQLRIDQFIREQEQTLRADYESKYGAVPYEDSWEPLEQTGEFFKGLTSGGVGLLESSLLGAATVLPEWAEDPTREFIRGAAYEMKPQADIGREGSYAGKLGQGVGSMGPLLAAKAIPGAGTALSAGLAVLSGAGEASERARAEGASENERALASLLGLVPGAFDYLPVAHMVSRFGVQNVKSYKAALGRILLQGGEEAAQEAAQELAQNLIAQGVYNPEQDLVEGVAESAGIGGGVGALVQTLMELVIPGKSRGSAAAPAAATPAAATPAAPATPPAPLAAESEESEFDDDSLIPLPFANTAAPVRPGTPEFENLTEARKAQEAAYSKAMGLGGGIVPGVMKLAAEGKGVVHVATGLGDTIDAVGRGAEDGEDRKKLRNDFVTQLFLRLGIPTDPKSPEFAKWKAQYDSFDGTKPKPPMVPKPAAEVAEAAAAKKGKAAANAASPAVAAEVKALAGTAPTEPTPAAAAPAAQGVAPVDPSVPTFTEDFVTKVLGFSPNSSTAAAAKTNSKVAGKPLTDPAVRAQLDALLKNKVVAAVRKDAIRKALEAPAPAPAPAPVVAEPVAEAPASAPVAAEPVAEAPAPVAAEPSVDAVINPGVVPRGPYRPESGAAPGQVGGLPGQPVPAPPPVVRKRVADLEAQGVELPRVKIPPREGADAAPPPVAKPKRGKPKPTRMKGVPTAEGELRLLARNKAAEARARDSVDNRELGDSLAAAVRAKLSPQDIEILGLDEIPSTRPDVTLGGDKRVILQLIGRGGAKTPEEVAAKRFFSKFPNPTEALEEIGAQSVVAPGQFQAKEEDPDPMIGFYRGMGRGAAVRARKWVAANLSQAANSALASARADADLARKRIIVRGELGKDPVEMERKAAEAEAAQMDELVWSDPRLSTAAGRNQLRMDIATTKAQTKSEVRRAFVADLVESPTRVPENFDTATKREDTTKFRGKTKFDRWMDETYSKEEQEALSDADLLQLYEDYAYSVVRGYALTKDATVALDTPVLPSVRKLILNGETKRAYDAIAATAQSSGVARIARALANKIGNTKIELVLGLTSAEGDPVSGLFDPSTNTIFIDSVDGVNVHTLLHEGTHAVVSATIDRPGHPLTAQLRTLFEKIKPAVGAAYGTSNLQEFAAELLSNPKFQARLAQLTVRGRKINALDMAFHAIRNFVRRLIGLPHVSMETALTRGDQIVMGMMAPAPEFRNGDTLYSAQAKGEAETVVANLINNAPTATQGRLAAASRIIGDTAYDTSVGGASLMKEALLRLTPLHYLAKIAEPYFPGMAMRLHDIVNAASGEMSRVRDTMQALSATVGKWASSYAAKVDTLNSLINNSTLHQVDPELTFDEASKKYGLDGERMEQWRMVKAEWDAVGPAGQAVYRTMRNTFVALRTELLRVMDLRLAASVPDEKVRRRLRDDLHEKILGKKDSTIEPYFPLSRKGDYWLAYNAIDHRTGKFERFVEAFESRSERRRFVEELKADPSTGAGSFTEMSRKDQFDFASAPPLSFMASLHNNLKRQNVDPKVLQTIAQVYLDTVPETSYLQAFRKRKGTLGFNRDALSTGVERASGLARSIVQLKYGVQLSALRSEMLEHRNALAKEGKDSDGIRQLHEQLDAFAQFAAAPDRHWAARLATTATFNMTLGFNVSTALLNLMQTPMILLPTLGGRYSWRASTRAIGSAMRLLSSAPHTREIDVYGEDGVETSKQRVSAAPSLENYDFNDPNLPPEVRRLRHLVEVGRDNGQFNRSIAYDILDVDNRLPSTSKLQNTLHKAQAGAGWMLHHTERFNRETAMAAAFTLEVDRIQKKEGRELTDAELRDAAKQAIYITEMTNGGTAAAATPRIAHSGLGQVIFMYKRYGVSMYALLFDTAKRAWRNADPEDRKIAFRQISGIVGMTGLLSGVAGLPMFGTIAMIANLFFDDEDLDFGMWVREGVRDGMYRGAVNALLGVNVASRVELSNLLFRESQIERDQSSLWTLIENIGGPVVGTGLNVERGINLMTEGRVYDGVMAAMPAPVRYVMRAIKYNNEGVITRGGDKIIDDLHPGHILAQALGFSSAELSTQQEINSARKRFEKAVTERHSKLTDRYAMAIRERNQTAMREVWEDIARFNADHPYWPITRDTLEKSMRSRKKTDERTFNGVSYNPKLVSAAMEFASDYGE